jgi:hypothetical protein
LISVDLPAPLWPRRPTTSPGVEVDRDVVDRLDAAEGELEMSRISTSGVPLRSGAG